jgi:NADP-dependent 3-hydroxy-3-methylglutaryl-CoA reductase
MDRAGCTAAPGDDLAGAITSFVVAEIAARLGYEPGDVAPDTPLADLGLDSLVAAEVAHAVERRFDLFVEPTLLVAHDTIASAARELGAQREPAAGASPAGEDAARRSGPASGPGTALDEIPGGGRYQPAAVEERLRWLRARCGDELRAIADHRVDPRSLRANVENFVGVSRIPIGLAGPLLVAGEHAQGVFYAPMATVEGTICMSATRGARAISESGGVRVRVLADHVIRAPFFVFRSLAECCVFTAWLEQSFARVKQEVDALSSHGALLRVTTHVVGCAVHARFFFDSGEASGQNMATLMTWRAVELIRDVFPQETGIALRYSAVEGNLAGDKKPNALNFFGGRGKVVHAEAELRREPYERVLGCTFAEVHALLHHGASASQYALGIGSGINAANMVAAIFAATGQDLGAIYEAATTHLFHELRDDSLYVSCLFPGLLVGTVGGAHGLPTQRECLAILGCDGAPHGARKLAEITAAFALALDVSTSAAVANGTFARSHAAYGRKGAAHAHA